jgi:hypothetical protein
MERLIDRIAEILNSGSAGVVPLEGWPETRLSLRPDGRGWAVRFILNEYCATDWTTWRTSPWLAWEVADWVEGLLPDHVRPGDYVPMPAVLPSFRFGGADRPRPPAGNR